MILFTCMCVYQAPFFSVEREESTCAVAPPPIVTGESNQTILKGKVLVPWTAQSLPHSSTCRTR